LPVARTSELFAERWTPIIIRNLLSGCRTFGDLLDGAPGMSKALLAQRLELLEDHGILTKQPSASGRGDSYVLTEEGRELKAVTDAMGSWGARWLGLEPQHIDAAYVLWATCKLVDVGKVPSKGLVARVDPDDRPTQRFWMLLRQSHAEVCSAYPGRAEDRSFGPTARPWRAGTCGTSPTSRRRGRDGCGSKVIPGRCEPSWIASVPAPSPTSNQRRIPPAPRPRSNPRPGGRLSWVAPDERVGVAECAEPGAREDGTVAPLETVAGEAAVAGVVELRARAWRPDRAPYPEATRRVRG
jgi:DNA-binding HxlR family transcriptional regulator